MTITLGHLAPIVALLCGILILVMPRLLNFIVAIYLIFVGLTGLFGIHLGVLSILVPIFALVAGVLILIGK